MNIKEKCWSYDQHNFFVKNVDASDPETPFSGVFTPTKRTFPTPSTVMVSPSATCVHNPLASGLQLVSLYLLKISFNDNES